MSEFWSHSKENDRCLLRQSDLGADFNGKDIRGKDFSNTTLQNASFHGAIAGLSPTWKIGLYLLVAFLSIIVGVIAAYAGALATAPTSEALNGDLTYNFSYVTVSLTLSSFVFAIVLLRGIDSALAVGSVVVVSIAIAAMAVIPNEIAQNTVSVLFAALAVAGSLAAVFNMSVCIAIVKTLASRQAFILSLLFAALGILLGSLLGVGKESSDLAYVASIVFGLATLAIGTYAGRQAMRGNGKYSLVCAIALAVYAKGGTSFRGADLTNADFTEAMLEGADFRGAILTRCCWFHAKNLNRARTGGTYLSNPDIRQLVVEKDASNLPMFNYLDLRDVNLAGAKLQRASFIGTDLSQATLAHADLSGAKLAKAQLYQTDLSEAILTGANIQDWGISTETKLDNVHCDFVYMRLPTEDDLDACRKPDNKHETFQPGDFADFISPIIKTLELYREQHIDMRRLSGTFKTLDLFHHGGIDPSAAAVALQQLAESYPEAGLEVVVLEGRGNEKVRLQARVAGDVDRSKLSAEYFAKYEQVKSLPYTDLQELLAAMAEKDERIQSYERLLENALRQPRFYVETYQNEGSTVMSNIDSSKGNVSISGVHGNISGVASAGENQSMTGAAIGEVSGSVTNVINQLSDLPVESGKPSLKELLTQLQNAIEAEADLTKEDKVEALEQVKAIAELGKQPQDNVLQKAAKTAIKILKGTITSLPAASKLVEECGKLLPKIIELLPL